MITQPLNRIALFAAALVLLAVGAGSGYWWAHRPIAPVAATEAGGRKILYWHDPMAPEQKFDKPGKSPFMDMPLVPVYADEAGSDAGVTVSSTAAQNLGIRLGKVAKTTRDVRLQAAGNVAFDDRLQEVVQARVEGYITHLYVKAPLERVHRGQPLAEMVVPQWMQAEQEYLALLDAPSQSAQGLRAAARQRLAVLGMPEASIHAVETDRKASAESVLLAPIDGSITELGVREGATFMPGTTLFRINGLATVWVSAQIPEAKVAWIKDSSQVSATATAWPGETFKGKVIALLPEVDAQTRTLTARIALDNAGRRLSPGMFVSVEFSQPGAQAQLVVPSEAVIATGERNVVITRDDGGAFHVVNVTLGAESNGQTVVLSGLEEGQSIVLSGQFLIDSEANLKSTVNRFDAEPKP
jgi:Cu(I)/Ag(I) efflux system membrane fusion protein